MELPAGYLFSSHGREIPERDNPMVDGREKRGTGTSRAENRL
jgi:hypothetical protein